MSEQVIADYERGGKLIGEAIAGLSREQLLAHPVPGTWSIQEIVVHLLDSDLIAMDRMKRIIAMENPLLIGYDENAFAKKLFYDEVSAGDVVTILDLSFRNFAKVLRKIPSDSWKRKGMHNERGAISLEEYLPAMVKHRDHHLKFVRDKRKMLGK
jgi:hypothetical protein